MKKVIKLIFIIQLLSQVTFSQDVAFVNYSQTPIQTNSAFVGFDNDLKVNILYKNQFAQIGQNFATPVINFVMPLFDDSKIKRIGGVGFSVISDSQGETSVLSTIGFSFAYAYNFYINKNQSISSSLSAGYFIRAINISNFTQCQIV